MTATKVGHTLERVPANGMRRLHCKKVVKVKEIVTIIAFFPKDFEINTRLNRVMICEAASHNIHGRVLRPQ